MTNTAIALQQFFSSFGLPAYAENYVPDGAKMPYITYELRRPDALKQASLYARIWYYDTSLVSVAAKVDAIKEAVDGGLSIQTGDGALRLWPDDNNFVQFEQDEDPNIKQAYLIFVLECDYR